MARRVTSSSISRVTGELRRLEQERQNTNARLRDLERQGHTLERVAQRTAQRDKDRDRDTGGRGSIIPDDRRHHRDDDDRPAKRRALDPSSSNPASPKSSSDTMTDTITVETAADRIRQAREERLRRMSSVETNASSRGERVREPDNALQSVVVAPKEEKEEGEATTHDDEKKTTTTTGKPDLKKRDRRMFAGLLGHLTSAQNRLTKDRSNAAQLKKIDLEAKIEKKMQEERIREKDVAVQRNKENVQNARQRLKDINTKQQQKRTLLLHHIIAAYDLSLSPFLETKKSSPAIYYLPKTHNDASRERLEQQTKQRKQHIEETCFVLELSELEREGLKEILEKGGHHQEDHKHDAEMEHEAGEGEGEVNEHEVHEEHHAEPEHEPDEPAITVTMKGDTKAISLRGKRKAADRDDDERSSTSPERR